MSTVTQSWKNTKQEKIDWFIKQLPIVSIIVLVSVGDSIVQNVTVTWLPVMGFVLGASLAGIGFWLFRKINVIEATRREKIAWISGISLFIIGGVIIGLNNSVATIFNVQWLHDTWGSLIFGLVLVCLGHWMIFSELFKRDRVWRFIGVFLHSLLLVGIIFKFGFGW